jgi:transcription initiation factor TFIIIB Brf1 subunit/transcription initiation factor TFIIB
MRKILPFKLDALKPSDVVTTLCRKLKLSHEVEMNAKYVAEQITKLEIISGKNPSSVASASLSLCLNLTDNVTSLNFREIAEKAQLAEVTVKTAYKS